MPGKTRHYGPAQNQEHVPGSLTLHTRPQALFLGSFTPETCLTVICAIHLVQCVFLISTASSVVEVRFATFIVTPWMQTSLAAWGLVGVFAITAAMVGVQHKREFPIFAYFLYLFVSVIQLACVCWSLIVKSTKCELVAQDVETQRLGLNLTCGILTAVTVCVAGAALMTALFGLYTVWQVKAHIHSSLEDDLGESIHLLRQQNKTLWQASEVNALPKPGRQPEWGSMDVKTTEI
eukprot:TRINITY_DN2819_c0_g1_i1.p1 TRINITY_DN2819_c0_g1~~TRINITY_DN2819_c0_g1_i1.p1  ORF type:complete len:235 (-),score=29.30 TRINITY_DN2819_c0_g1_i1:74-778(-)